MTNEHLDGRRLRFPVRMGDRESIPGAIVRSVRQHVLVRTAPVLEAAGVDLRHAGFAQVASPEELERLAFVTRCPANDFIARGGKRLFRPDEAKSYEARFGSLVIPRVYLEFNRRRIGPVTLATEPYHRASWMNALLPYCPESLERLVDCCGHCNAPLGWFYSLGVGQCDRCGEDVRKSEEALLPAAMAADYRLFALLSSPDARGVDEACARLPTSLTGVSPGSLVRLALLLGGLVQPDPVATSNRNALPALPSPTLAAVVSSGTELLRSWPNGLRAWVAEKTAELRGSPAALTNLRSRMKRMADKSLEPADMVAAAVAALPDLHMHAAHGFTVDRPYYLYKYVQRTLGLSSPSMAALKKWPGIKFFKLNTGGKEQGQFDVEQIDGLVPVFRGSAFMNSCAEGFGVPLYAIEQLCAVNVLEWEGHPALLAIGASPKVRTSSIARLTNELVGKARLDRMPADCVSIAVANKRVGGRLKPWASILEALLNGRVAFWMTGDRLAIPSLRIRANDIGRFQMIVDKSAPEGLPVSTVVSQEDAAEILNIAAQYVPALSLQLKIPFERNGRGYAASRTAILAAASNIAWNAEIALHEGVHHSKINDILSARRIRPLHTGWNREHLIAEGIIPPPPVPRT